MNAAIALAAALALGAAPKSIPESAVGLAKAGPADVVAPAAVKENDSAPGERPVRPRAYPGAPPVIPHGVEDFLPIRADRNACLDCHAGDDDDDVKEEERGKKEKKRKKEQGEPTHVPASHHVDLRNAPGKRQERVDGARWSCTACHVPQQDVAPLVKSPFPR